MESIKDIYWKSLKHFTRDEFIAPGYMKMSLLAKLDMARELARVPFVITSSYRAGDPGAHGEGKAVDISCTNSKTRLKIVRALITVGFNRIGVYRRHIHADISDERAQDVLWYGRYHPETQEVSDEAQAHEQTKQQEDVQKRCP